MQARFSNYTYLATGASNIADDLVSWLLDARGDPAHAASLGAITPETVVVEVGAGLGLAVGGAAEVDALVMPPADAERRAAMGLPPPVTVGVALADQIVEGEIPVGPLDR